MKLTILLLIVSMSLFCLPAKAQSEPVVAWINGEPVILSEFLAQMRAGLIARTYNYYTIQYSAEIGPEFWDQDFHGEKPLDYLRRLTLEQVTRNKVILLLLKEYGLIESVHYVDILKAWEAENHRRQALVDQGEVIYGPIKYTETQYFAQLINTGVLKLADAYAAGHVPIAYLSPPPDFSGVYHLWRIEHLINEQVAAAQVVINHDIYGSIYP